MMVLLRFAYEDRAIFRLMYKSGLIGAIMKFFDQISDWPEERSSAYLRAFFVYGYFGVIWQWIGYDFDETPEQIQQHSVQVLQKALQDRQAGGG